MSTTQELTDYGPTTRGTGLQGAYLNALVPTTSSSVMKGGYPSSTSGLNMTMPLTQVVVMVSGVPVFAQGVIQVISCAVGSSAQDNYVDLDTSGSYHITSGTVGFTPSAVASGRIRLFMARTNSTNTSILLINTLFTYSPLTQGNVQYDPTETSSNDTLTHQSTLVNTLHRINYSLTTAASLPQTQSTIPVDLTEAMTYDTLSGGSHLINNLNRIRYTQNQVTNSIISLAQSLAVSKPPHYTSPTVTPWRTNTSNLDYSGNNASLSGGSTDYSGTVTWGSVYMFNGAGLAVPQEYQIAVVTFAYPFQNPTVTVSPQGLVAGDYGTSLIGTSGHYTGFTLYYVIGSTVPAHYSGSVPYTVTGP